MFRPMVPPLPTWFTAVSVLNAPPVGGVKLIVLAVFVRLVTLEFAVTFHTDWTSSATKLSPLSVELLAVQVGHNRPGGRDGYDMIPGRRRRRAGLDKFGDSFDLRMRRERKRPPRFLESH